MKSSSSPSSSPILSNTPIHGIIFRRTIRAAYASLDIVLQHMQHPIQNDVSCNLKLQSQVINESKHPKEEPRYKEEHAIVLLKFHNDEKRNEKNLLSSSFSLKDVNEKDKNSALSESSSTSYLTTWRSHIRRICKIGTLIELVGGKWITQQPPSVRRLELKFSFDEKQQKTPQNNNNGGGDWRITSVQGSSVLKVIQIQKWNMVQCQLALSKYYPSFSNGSNSCRSQDKKERMQQESGEEGNQNNTSSTVTTTHSNISLSERKKKKHGGQTGHGGGIGKKKTGRDRI